MIIFGPCIDPRITINGHVYQVFDTVEKGEYITINSINMTIIKNRNNGTTANLWDYQAKEESVFSPIPGNVISVNWSGTFGFDLTLFEERSEPAW